LPGSKIRAFCAGSNSLDNSLDSRPLAFFIGKWLRAREF
jgi:hypothetical protein